ncbi:hypothetical protein QVD17_36996 [Tagetes erecta]|uniref:Protein FMP32, mitochondrial n=1 Tax=Tagetes erecta TaxID=13708 RepID=A0AAD8JVR4_TARER|nr:hypothetical protein QVD17_36996 [Tagetes erecta]
MATACIRAGTKLRSIQSINSPVFKCAFVPSTSSSSSHCYPRFDFRQISQLAQSNAKRVFLVDTLALVRRLEGEGVPTKQAEAIQSAITEVLNDSLENVAQSFVSKGEMQRIEMTQDGNLGRFKSQVHSSQENHFSSLQRETEKLRNDIEKMRSELRYEIDKVNAGQRLDLNLERGRIRDELANQNQETTNLTNKLDREIHALRALLEAAKYDVIKYCIGTLVSISAVGLAVLRILILFDTKTAKPFSLSHIGFSLWAHAVHDQYSVGSVLNTGGAGRVRISLFKNGHFDSDEDEFDLV